MFDCDVLPDPGSGASGTGEAWSTYSPDGLLADILSEASGGSSWDRLERIGGWERLIAFAQAAQLREIARFAVAAESDPVFGDDPEQVAASVCAEVGLMTRLAPRTADGRVSDAIALVERLPATMRALSAGLISLAGARAIADETFSLDPEQALEAEARVLEKAPGQTSSQLRASTRRAVARIDADAVRRRAEKARQERHVALVPEPDGMATLSAYLPAHEAVAAYEVLDECARRAAGPGDTRTMDARRADALVDLVLDRHSQPGRDAATTPRPRDRVGVQVRVTVPLTTLLGLDQLPAELAGYGPIPADVARELAAHGTWRRLITDPVSGALLDYGTTRYRPPTHLADHVIARAQVCGYPACRVPAHRCDLDHRIQFDAEAGTGPTSDENLDPHCKGHHLLKHSPGWNVTRGPDGTLIWRTPTGHEYRREPPPVGEPTVPPTSPPPSPAEPEPDDEPPPF